MPLLEAPVVGVSNNTAPDPLAVSSEALLFEAGPLGTIADVPTTTPVSDHITIYSVRAGENISQIAKMFDVTADTIRWANDLGATATVTPDQILVIPPISGVIHVVKKGDTIASIAKLYKADVDDILTFNDLGGATTLAVGDSIIVPDGRIETIKKPAVATNSIAGYFMRPIKGGRKTVGIHGHNGVDLAAPVGTPIVAAAAGKVVISRYGWNGAYGNYVVINHSNGTQTLYAHASELLVSEGQYVKQGQTIAKIGLSGRTTGAHLHFEVHGAKNPF